MPITPVDIRGVGPFCDEAIKLLDALQVAKEARPGDSEIEELNRKVGIELHAKVAKAKEITEASEQSLTRADYRAHLDAIRVVIVRLVNEVFEPVSS
jgi:hypothetical protein